MTVIVYERDCHCGGTATSSTLAVDLSISTGELHIFHAKSIVLATGGSGRMYKTTSNAHTLTGDGLGMAARAGVPLRLPQAISGPRGADIAVALRPEAVHLSTAWQSEGDVTLAATVSEVQFMGSVIRLKAKVSGGVLALDTFNRADAPPPKLGAQIGLAFTPRYLIVLQK